MFEKTVDIFDISYGLGKMMLLPLIKNEVI